jgi:hypothetical protein
MKYLLKAIGYCILLIIFAIAWIVSFLWSLKVPKMTIDFTFRDDAGGGGI